jgi:hypothetical protein
MPQAVSEVAVAWDLKILAHATTVYKWHGCISFAVKANVQACQAII